MEKQILTIKGRNMCMKFGKEIDYELVKVQKPNCIEKNNGCGNCSFCKYLEEVKQEAMQSKGLKEKKNDKQ